MNQHPLSRDPGLTTTDSPPSIPASTGWITALYELTKPRLSFLSVATALLTYWIALPTGWPSTLFWLIIGTAASAGGAASLNQWMERRTDALMRRTASRPLPAGLIPHSHALFWGLFLGTSGIVVLALKVHPFSAFYAALTLFLYLCVYTPMKRTSHWATEVGAVSGALPPLIGWTAAGEGHGLLGWVCFGILFAWQMPHFMAIAWLYRHDYARAGFPQITVIDSTGTRAARLALVYTALLTGISLVPPLAGAATWWYGSFALLAGAWLGWKSLHFQSTRLPRDMTARALFLASVLYLPLLMIALALDRSFLSP